jgi:hypothetical protein
MDYLDRVPIVFDDGGFPFAAPDGSGFRVGLEPYGRILDLAEKNDVVIPVAVTSAFIDTGDIAGLGMAHESSGEIIDFLLRNRERMPVWNHGLTHRIQGHFTEFGKPREEKAATAERQEKHLRLSQEIFHSAGLGRPNVFVPPGHVWESGVTDRIAAMLGIRYMAVGQFLKAPIGNWLLHPLNPHLRRWTGSDHLELLFRHGTGIPHTKTRFSELDRLKASLFLKPGSRLVKQLVFRTASGISEPHHYFAHVQNLVDPASFEFWDFVIGRILSDRPTNREGRER